MKDGKCLIKTKRAGRARREGISASPAQSITRRWRSQLESVRTDSRSFRSQMRNKHEEKHRTVLWARANRTIVKEGQRRWLKALGYGALIASFFLIQWRKGTTSLDHACLARSVGFCFIIFIYSNHKEGYGGAPNKREDEMKERKSNNKKASY